MTKLLITLTSVFGMVFAHQVGGFDAALYATPVLIPAMAFSITE